MENHEHKHLHAIIRKPQEGKTFICLESIVRHISCIHLIITMNTIKSNLQFFERASCKFGGKICIFNSKSKYKDDTINHAKDVTGVIKKIKEGSDIIIMCAHSKRFDDSIINLLSFIEDSKTINKNVLIHIDEAHAYVPRYRKEIAIMNNYIIVQLINLYSATPFNIWSDEYDILNDYIFKNIYVVDIEAQMSIMKSEEYFGVKDCEFDIGYSEDMEMLDPIISDKFIQQRGVLKDTMKPINTWYGEGYPFSLGNEIMLISYTRYSLNKLKDIKRIENNKFSYNFVPAYIRKLTHYAIMELILSIYNTAIVIVINGNGSCYYKYDSETTMSRIELENNNEPSIQIEKCIKKNPNVPIFITGFHCVGMSVTFINERIGNFDNVIMTHDHFNPDILYQLCRFLFNYISWKPKNKENIKKTMVFSKSQKVINTCLDYENQIDVIEDKMSGSIRTRDEVAGSVKIKRKKIPKEKKFDKLEPFSKIHPVKTFPVEDGDDEEKYKAVMDYYMKFTGKELKGKSIPKKNDKGFYECSTTDGCEVKEDPNGIKKWAKKLKWDSNFQITHTQRKYCRVYVAYEDKTDNTDYTWIIRRMEINPENDPEKETKIKQIFDEINRK